MRNSTDRERFQSELTRRTKEADACVLSYLVPDAALARPVKVLPAMRYAADSGGKRLRPVLMRLSFELFHGEKEELLKPFMAAAEFIHSYSLVHDDLPAMDNDLYRRGRKTVHAAFGEWTAILAGDGLLNLAFETALLSFDACESSEEKNRVIAALRVLFEKSGIRGMVGGQSADLEAEREREEIRDGEALLSFIQENKTAALIEASFLCGALLAGARDDDTALLQRIAFLVGMAFQIEDDILDVTAASEAIGKTAGKDEAAGKLTYVSLYGLDKAREDAAGLTEEALSLLARLDPEQESFLFPLIAALSGRER